MPLRPSRRRRRRSPLARLRRRPVLWWAAAAALAALTFATVDSASSRADAVLRRYGRLRTVPVASRAVEAGRPVAAGAVRWERRPARFLPAAPVARRPEGRVALVGLVEGEVLVESRLAPNRLAGPPALMPPGSRALTVPGGLGGRPPVRVADRVDILAAFPQAPEPVAVVASAGLVVAVDPQADTVTVAVRREEAPQVAFALAAGAVTLALTTAGG